VNGYCCLVLMRVCLPCNHFHVDVGRARQAQNEVRVAINFSKQEGCMGIIYLVWYHRVTAPS